MTDDNGKPKGTVAVKPKAKRKPRKKIDGRTARRKDLTDEQVIQIEALASVLTQGQIADYFGMSDGTLRKRMYEYPEVAEAYARGRARTIGGVAKNLVNRAMAGDHNAQQFYLLSQGGWRISHSLEHTGPGGGPIQVQQLTDDELKEKLGQAKNRLAALEASKSFSGNGKNGGSPG